MLTNLGELGIDDHVPVHILVKPVNDPPVAVGDTGNILDEDAQRAYVQLEAAQRMLRAQGRTSWLEVRLDDWRRLAPCAGTHACVAARNAWR